MSVTASAVIATTLFGAQSAEAASYKVKQGDTLWGISQKHNTSVSQLRTLNNLTSDIIFPNQVLEVGGTATATPNKTASNNKASAPKKQSSNSNSSSKGKTYTVKKGDNLSKIAAAHGISLKNLKEWNNLKSDLIFPGQVFQVGGKASANSTPPKQSSSKPKQE